MISRKKNVSVQVDRETMKSLRRASASLSQLATAYITVSDGEPLPEVRTTSR